MDFPHKALRVGLLIDSWQVPSWIASIAADIIASKTAEIVVVVDGGVGNQRRFHSHYRPRPNLGHFAQLYLYLDYRIFHSFPDALEQVDLKERLAGYPVIETELLFDGLSFCFNEQDKKQLQELEIDVLLLFCAGLPVDQVLPIARYGFWFFLDHELLLTGHPPVGFWEVLQQHHVTMQCLQARTAKSPKPIILQRYYGPTDLRSIRRSRNNLLWKSASFVTRKLDELHRFCSLEAIASGEQCCEDGFSRRAPSNLTMLKTIASHESRFVRDRTIDHYNINQWRMAYKFTSAEQFFDHNFADYHWLLPPKDRSWADPFPVQIGDHYFLFFEEFLYREKKGHLCVAPVDENGFKEEPKIILKQKYHLSYPFVFYWKREWNMIPETQAANRIDIYKFASFPYKLSYYKTVMENVKAADTTLTEINGRWWMFVAIASQGTWNVDELFLFYADNPFGPWVPHPKNPIKSDVRSARPAGRVLAWRGKYYRPAQDCSRRYGYAIRLQEIKVLSEKDYVEEEAEVILPNWSPDIIATHTLNIAGALTVIDINQWRRR
jgi:hypothetical protein